MDRGISRIFIGIIAFILLMITIVVILASGGGSKPSTKAPTAVTLKALPDYASTNATVSMETQGRVVGDEDYRTVRVTIGRDQREVQIMQGYSGNVISNKVYYNTQAAYDVFLRSIRGSGFTIKLKNTKYGPDERGICPLGNRYIFTLSQNNDDLSRLWGSSCGTATGTFGGSRSVITTLFQAQIPDYSTVTSGVRL